MRIAFSKSKNIKTALYPIIFFLTIILIFGHYYINHTNEQKQKEKENLLQAVAELKISEISYWLKERLFDINLITNNKFFIEKINIWLKNKSASLKKDIEEQLLSYKSNLEYENVLILNNDGELLFAADKKLNLVDSITKEKAKESLLKKETVFTDLYFCETYNKIHYDIISPLAGENGSIISLVLLRIDPDVHLYPLIQTWPTPSYSAETYIVRRDGDYAVILNKLRHSEEPPLTLKVHISKKERAAAQVVLGHIGIHIGKDYRKEDVMAYTAPIPKTNWFIVSKLDIKEIRTEARETEILLFIILGFIIISSIGGLLWFYYSKEKNFYKNLYQKQEEFTTVVNSIGDAVITTDEKGKIKHLNPKAEELTGWSNDEAIDKDLENVFKIINEETRLPAENPTDKVLKEGITVGLANHTLLISKEGKEIPIADSAAPIKNEEGKIIGVVLVFRDQSEERLKQKMLQTRAALFEYSVSRNLDEILTKTLDEAEKLTESKIGYFHFVNENQETLQLKAWSTLTINEFCTAEGKDAHYSISQAGVWAESIRQRRPIIYNDYNTLLDKKGLPVGHANVVRMVSIPIFRNNKIVAVIGLGNKSTDYNDKDIEVITFLADVAWEIAEKKILDEQKTESERKFFSMINNLNGIVYRSAYDKDWTMQFLSDSVFTLTGYPSSDFIDNKVRSFASIVHPEDNTYLENDLIKKALENKQYFTIEYRIITASNQVKWVWEKGCGVFQNDKLVALEGFITDITEMKRTQLERQVISDIISGIVTTSDITELLKLIHNSIKKVIYAENFYVALYNKDTNLLYFPYFVDQFDEPPASIQLTKSCTALVLKRGEHLLITESYFQQLIQQGEVEEIGTPSPVWLGAPLKTLTETIGVMVVQHYGDENAYSQKDVEFFVSVSNQVALAIQRKQADEALKESEETFRNLFEHSADPILLLDDTRFVDCNKATLEFLKYNSKTEFLNTQPWEISPELQPDGIPSHQKALLMIARAREKGHNHFEWIHTKKDGTNVPVEVMLTPIILNGKQFYYTIWRDISDRYRAMEILKSSEERFRLVAEKTGQLIYDYNILSGKITWSGAIEKLTGYTCEEFSSVDIDRWGELIHPDDRQQAFELLNNCIIIAKPYQVQYRFRKKDGNYIIIEDEGGFITDKDGKSVRMLGAMRDITEQKAAQEKLRGLTNIIETSINEVYVFDTLTLKFIYLNNAAIRNLGFSNDEIYSLTPVDIKPEFSLESFKEMILPLLNGEKEFLNFETLHQRKNGTIYPVEVNLQLSVFDGKKVFAAIILDITQRKLAETALRESEENLFITLNSIGDGVITTDQQGNIQRMNPIAEKLCGWSLDEAYGKPLSEVFIIVNSDTRQPVENPVQLVMNTGKIVGLANHTVLISRNGNEYQIADSAAPIIDKEGNIKGVVLVFSDVTEKYEIQKAIRESQRVLSTLVDNLPGMAYRQAFDKNWTTFFISKSCYNITGYHPEDFINNSKIAFNDIIVEEFREEIWNKWNEILPKKEIFIHEYQIRRADGQIRWVWERGQGVYDNDGNVLFLEGYIEDITEEKLSKIELEKSEEKYRLIVENNHDGIIVSQDDKIIYSNLQFANMLGYDLDEIINMSFRNIYTEEALKDLYERHDKRLKGEAVVKHYQTTYYRKDGSIIDVLVNYEIIEYNNKPATFATIKDITELKKAEEETKKLTLAVEQSPASVVITDINGNIEYVNEAFCKITGYNKEEVIGKNPRILKSGYHDKAFYEDLWGTILSGQIWRGEIRNKRKDGELFWESARISAITNTKGETIHFLAVKEDITIKKQMIEELIAAKEAAEKANKLKDTFIANISHEIRTPLNGILGLTTIIKETFEKYITEEYMHLFAGIDKSSNRLIRTVDMILNYSRIHSGEFPIKPKKLNLSTMCQNAFEEFSLRAKSKSLEFSFLNNIGNVEIVADEFCVSQSISNLIDNAIKYTNQGFIKISLSKNEKEEVIMDVQDSGIGISEEFLTNIFEPYRQEQIGRGRAYEGVGLGLSLVKKLLSLNNFSISVISTKNVGSTFSINFGKSI